jgi:large subunit ribosomal protein L19
VGLASREVVEEDESRGMMGSEFRQVYPEFLPDPKQEYRNPIREKLERFDMIKRRSQIDIPEFYVGMRFSFQTLNIFSFYN